MSVGLFDEWRNGKTGIRAFDAGRIKIRITLPPFPSFSALVDNNAIKRLITSAWKEICHDSRAKCDTAIDHLGP